ncbi:protein obstructor-E-like [Cylas formicarius]|uniref:protein obstructor-E-like n=1 Tax=Cylas formicarius TaxID=197179 RepID=UPI00295845C5|nr:protein obstructor-E-like [Cylas formicarius]
MKNLRVLIFVTTLCASVLCQFNSRYSNRQQEPNFVRDVPQVTGGSFGSCLEPNGTFPTSMCDGYIQCVNGIAEEKICPDGLLFNPSTGPHAFPCQYPIDVDCTGREQTQPAQATDECPHQFGYFRIGDAQNCGQFKNCVDGRGFIFDCPEGLAFNGDTYRCDWPDQVPSCDAEAYLGFSCPPDARAFGFGQEEYRYFRSPSDCQRYFVCIEGKPRLYNCGNGKAFNDLSNQCDDVENVTGCAIPQYQDRSTGPVKLTSFNDNRYNRF